MRLTCQEYATLVEQAPILIWRSDTTGACDYFNERWLSFTGRALQAELGAGWAEGVHPDDMDRCMEIYTTAFGRREVFEMRYRLRRHDGQYRWIFDRGVPMFDAAGVFGGFIGSCTDITGQVEAELALEEAHRSEVRRLEQLLPMCACCKKIRDDTGYWEQLEVYLRDQAGTRFSHSLCPGCADDFVHGLASEETKAGS